MRFACLLDPSLVQCDRGFSGQSMIHSLECPLNPSQCPRAELILQHETQFRPNFNKGTLYPKPLIRKEEDCNLGYIVNCSFFKERTSANHIIALPHKAMIWLVLNTVLHSFYSYRTPFILKSRLRIVL